MARFHTGRISGVMPPTFSGVRADDGGFDEPRRTLAVRHVAKVGRGNLRIDAAAMVLDLGRHQVIRRLDRIRAVGVEGLVSRKHRRPNDRRDSGAFRDQVIVLMRALC